MLKLMVIKIFTVLRSKIVFIYTYVRVLHFWVSFSWDAAALVLIRVTVLEALVLLRAPRNDMLDTKCFESMC